MDQAPLINEASKLEESLRSFVGKLPETEEVLKDCLVTAACNLIGLKGPELSFQKARW